MSDIPYKFNPVITPLPPITSGVNGIFVSRGGNLFSSGLFMSGAYLQNTYDMQVFSGGIVRQTEVQSGGTCVILSGGTADKTIVNYSGKFIVSSRGYASRMNVLYGGQMFVFSSGYANNVHVSSGGFLNLSSGGTCANFYVEHANAIQMSSAFIFGATVNGGMLTIAEDNYEEPQSRFSTISAISAQIMVSSTCKVYSMYAESGGYIEFVGGAYAENAVARNGGIVRFNVSGSGIGFGVYSGGTGIIASGAKVQQALFVYPGGSAVIESGGTCNGGLISSGGTLLISSGGTANNITSAPGAVIIHG